MKHISAIVFLYSLILLCPENAMCENVKSFLQDEWNGWRAPEQVKLYDNKTIFNYLDGGAELYLAYNMEELYSRRYRKENEADIVVDIFKMKSAKNAFGLFSHDYQKNDAHIGTDSEYQSGLLVFWKDKYYVSIMSENETPNSKNAVMNIGRNIARMIKADAPPPRIIHSINIDKIKLITMHYFNNAQCLNFYYFIGNKNILNLNESTEGVFAEYAISGRNIHLLLIGYPNAEELNSAYEKYFEQSVKMKKTPDALKLKDGKWIALRTIKNFLAIVLDAQTQPDANLLLASIETNLRN